jgi:hypothetical protein
MIRCPACHFEHPTNTLFCVECGEYLGQGSQKITGTLPEEEQQAEETKVAEPQTPAPSEPVPAPEPPFATGTPISLSIGDTKRKMTLAPKKEILLGRLDPSTANYPDVDLTVDGGLENGVSRRHAKITCRPKDIVIEDLGSVNGTFLNGKRLTPYLPQPLRSGDQLHVGKLLVLIQF